jgi:hypothetical protein
VGVTSPAGTLAVIPLTADTKTPAWLSHALTLLIPVVAGLIAIFRPGDVVNTPSAQAVLMLGALVMAGVIHVALLAKENGLTKAGLAKTITEEEAWIRSNYGVLRSTFEAAKPALDLIPGVPAALATAQADLEQVKATVAGIPAVQKQAVLETLSGLVGQSSLARPSVPTGPPGASPAGPVAAATL